MKRRVAGEEAGGQRLRVGYGRGLDCILNELGSCRGIMLFLKDPRLLYSDQIIGGNRKLL